MQNFTVRTVPYKIPHDVISNLFFRGSFPLPFYNDVIMHLLQDSFGGDISRYLIPRKYHHHYIFKYISLLSLFGHVYYTWPNSESIHCIGKIYNYRMFKVWAPRPDIQWIIQHCMSDSYSHQSLLNLTLPSPGVGSLSNFNLPFNEWDLTVSHRES